MKRLLAFLLCLFPVLADAQAPAEPYARDWTRADSFLSQGLPQSARTVIESVATKAAAKGQALYILKAQLYLLQIDQQSLENADSLSIARAEERAHTTAFPYNAVWQSIAAQLYWNYYLENRWQIYSRTRTAEAVGDDFENWDASRFVERISTLYQQSLSRSEDLKKISLEAFEPVLEEGTNTRNLRPTLFDLLAYRALAFYEWDEKDLPRPAYAFVMDDPAALAPASDFIRHDFTTRDTASLQHQALGLYQDLLRIHRDDAKPDAFLEADLARLEFANRTSVLSDKKSRYEAALARIADKYSSNPLSALAAFRLASSRYGETEETGGAIPPGRRPGYDDDGDDRRSPRKNTADFVALKKALEAIIAAHPQSEGGVLAAQKRAEMLTPSLAVQTEEAVLPGEPSKFLVEYRNLPQAYFRIVPLTLKEAQAAWRNRYSTADNPFTKKLTTGAAVQTFSSPLPGTADFAPHSTEVKMDALPPGLYAVVYSKEPQFAMTENLLGFAVFNVTRLAMISQNGRSGGPAGYVLDRKTGAPVAGATVTLYDERYNPKSQEYDVYAAASATSSADGTYTVTSTDRYFQGFAVRKGDDLHAGFEGFSLYANHAEDRAQTRTFFFTDRSIYRPGQTIFYKGILLRTSDHGRKSVTVPSAVVDVTFYDANGQKVATQKVTSNEFGSFTGSFVAPQGVLTGQMRLDAVLGKESTGSAYVSVEEYKRPKFRVVPDTVKAEFGLAETVTLRSTATSYSGAPVGGAQVEYRVVRQARWPYYWYSWRWGGGEASPAQEIAQGTATTDEGGAFTVSFTTLPDPTIDERSLPTFTYTVTADVTDINGETRTGVQTIHAGYRSLQISASIPEKATPDDLDTLRITTQNLAGGFLPARVTMKLTKLQAPDKLYRARRWPMPDQRTKAEGEFRRLFPLDEWAEESDYKTWSEGATVQEETFTTTEAGRVSIPKSKLTKNGWYVLTLSAKDKAGRPVEDKRYVHLWAGEGGGKAEDPLLVVPSAVTKEPGETARMLTTSGFERATVLQQVHTMPTVANRNAVSRASKAFDGQPLIWEKRISEEDRGGIALHFLTLKENRVYTDAASIAVPWTNKDLDISWETHRDKLLPGQQETWTMVVRGAKKDKVAAELAATLYDASLDAFRPHGWSFGQLLPMLSAQADWNTGLGFGRAYGNAVANDLSRETFPVWEKMYEDFVQLDEFTRYEMMREDERQTMDRLEAAASRGENLYVVDGIAADGAIRNAPMVQAEASSAKSAAPVEVRKRMQFAPPVLKEDAEVREEDAQQPVNVTDVPLRKNLQETAFFFPQLRTDADGAVRLTFTIPEALTEWKLLAIAHTPDAKTGAFAGTVKTQKDLMVVPGLPRFLRQGDDIALSAKITNLSDAEMTGTAMLEILDAQTGRSLTLPFGLKSLDQDFTAPKGGSTTAVWNLRVPESLYEPVIIRIRAKSGAFTDGEENVLPVITNRMLVTETLPLWMNGTGTKTFTLEKLLQSGGSSSLAQHALTLEYTGNPAWYAVQALPYLMEYPYECSEQTFNRYYANALASHIAVKAPRVKEIFKQWETLDTAALMSNLQKNEELKSALLEETPWVMEAKNETEQKHRIALLFESTKLARDLDKNARKLEDMLLDEGGFPWFKGSPYPDRYITQYIATGIGRLQHLGVKGDRMDKIADRILPYLDRKMNESYDYLIKEKADTGKQHIGYIEVQYLYMRSLFPNKALPAQYAKAAGYYRRQAQKFWPEFNPYMKGSIALALHRGSDARTPKTILQSLRETAQQKEELGMWWMERGQSWWWYEAPIEAQALLVECFQEVGNDATTADKLRRWLLKQKQTQNWSTTRATADACYALLLQGTQWLDNNPDVTVQLGERLIRSADLKGQAGTGYFKVRIPGSEVKADMGSIKLTVSQPQSSNNRPTTVQPSSNHSSWGAVYWQYFEDLDKITAAQTPLVVRKQLFIERNTDRGPVLEKISDGNALRIGDKVKARIEHQVDRDMEYVHLKDGRGACFEPTAVISGYRWQGGLGYYESTRDVSSNFFFDRLPKGKYVFEYPMFVTHAGDFSAGLATVQCMYAPEFSAHSEGVRVRVK